MIHMMIIPYLQVTDNMLNTKIFYLKC